MRTPLQQNEIQVIGGKSIERVIKNLLVSGTQRGPSHTHSSTVPNSSNASDGDWIINNVLQQKHELEHAGKPVDMLELFQRAGSVHRQLTANSRSQTLPSPLPLQLPALEEVHNPTMTIPLPYSVPEEHRRKRFRSDFNISGLVQQLQKVVSDLQQYEPLHITSCHILDRVLLY